MEEKALRAVQAVFGLGNWRAIEPVIPIYDASGPLLFNDYRFSDNKRLAWVRLMPRAKNLIVSIESGNYPAAEGPTIAERIEIIPSVKGDVETLNTMRSYLAKKFHPIGDIVGDLKYFNDRMYCYHYPNIGTMITDSDGRTGFKDVVDGKVFYLSEMGNDTSETRQINSFLNSMPEAGEPGPIVAPTPTKSLHGDLYGQLRDNWCSVASCEMLLDFYKIEVAQPDIASQMGIADQGSGGADLGQQTNAYQRFFGDTYSIVPDTTALAQNCINELAQGRPVKIGIIQHAQACFGWTTTDDGVIYEIYDPMPVGKGARKWQNPGVVWSINHIYVRKQDNQIKDQNAVVA